MLYKKILFQKFHLLFPGLIVLLISTSCNNRTVILDTHKAPHPNIIFILADDLGYGDVGFNGQKHIKTPNIDQLAAEGMVFTQHYAGSTVCGPSRSVLLTGQFSVGPGYVETLPGPKVVNLWT
ncbi:MAG: sulfatase-like hydrolase/transferase [Cyclobacteriaceae bacterium]